MYTKWFLLLVITVFISDREAESSTFNRTIVREYDVKVCYNEPSCHLLTDPYVVETRSTIDKRNCMCDAACVEYRDCCTDTSYYNTEKQSPTQTYQCSVPAKVYMKVDCPLSWFDETIRSLCQNSQLPLTSNDTTLIIPVTDTVTNITYANNYCALCHERNESVPWLGNPACGEVNEKFLTENGTLKNNIKLSIDYNKYARKAHQIWQTAAYAETVNRFVGRYEDKVFVCQLWYKLPLELKPNVRVCVPNVVESCPADSEPELVNKCRSRTALVYLTKNSKKVYRNINCALCNGVSLEEVTGCPVYLKE